MQLFESKTVKKKIGSLVSGTKFSFPASPNKIHVVIDGTPYGTTYKEEGGEQIGNGINKETIVIVR